MIPPIVVDTSHSTYITIGRPLDVVMKVITTAIHHHAEAVVLSCLDSVKVV